VLIDCIARSTPFRGRRSRRRLQMRARDAAARTRRLSAAPHNRARPREAEVVLVAERALRARAQSGRLTRAWSSMARAALSHADDPARARPSSTAATSRSCAPTWACCSPSCSSCSQDRRADLRGLQPYARALVYCREIAVTPRGRRPTRRCAAGASAGTWRCARRWRTARACASSPASGRTRVGRPVAGQGGGCRRRRTA